MFTALKQAWPFLALFGLGVVAVAATRPKGDADVLDLSDYHAKAAGDLIWQRAPARAAWPLIDRKPMSARPAGAHAAPLELTDVPWTPPYAELTVAAVTRRYGDNPADIAARWLREAGEQARVEMAGAR